MVSMLLLCFHSCCGAPERCFENTDHLMVLLRLQLSQSFPIQFLKKQELLAAFYMFQMSNFLFWAYPLCPQANKSYDYFIPSQESRTSWHIVATQCMFVKQMNRSLPFSFCNATVFIYLAYLSCRKFHSK